MALATVVLVLAVVNVWVHIGPRGAHPVTGPLAAALLLVVGRAAGLSWEAMGLGRDALARGALWGGVGAALVGTCYAVALAVPSAHRFFCDTRYRLGPGSALYEAFVAIPLGTVVFEEVAFRGVLWGLLEEEYGAVGTTAASSVLFGLWHVLPALDMARTNASLPGKPGGTKATTLAVLGTVAFTTVAGIVFAELRRRTGSLLAPILLHWATNGLGVLAAARVWAVSR
jgi:membrane protease YdiL (CAAX protease family)